MEYRPEAYEAVEAAALAALKSGSQVVLDLDGLTALDSVAVRGLISMLRRARAGGGEIALRTTRPEILRTLSVTGLDRVFTTVQPEPVR